MKTRTSSVNAPRRDPCGQARCEPPRSTVITDDQITTKCRYAADTPDNQHAYIKVKFQRLMDRLDSAGLNDLMWVIDNIRQWGYYCDGGACASLYAHMVDERIKEQR